MAAHWNHEKAQLMTLPPTNMAPENWRLEDEFLFGETLLPGAMLVSGRVTPPKTGRLFSALSLSNHQILIPDAARSNRVAALFALDSVDFSSSDTTGGSNKEECRNDVLMGCRKNEAMEQQ